MPRKLLVVVGLLAVFVVVATLMVAMMPKPAANSDYLVAGSVATLVTLAVAFFFVVRNNPDQGAVFLKKRKKQG